jgi:hypothetical protein
MWRWIRIGFRGVVAISLILFMAAASMWVRSYYVNDWFMFRKLNPAARSITDCNIISDLGIITVHWQTPCKGWPEAYESFAENEQSGFTYQRDVPDFTDAPDSGATFPLPFHGFLFDRQSPNFITVELPYWPLVVVTSFLPMAVVLRTLARRLRGRWRDRNGLCRNCGYDLRSSRERCPECGTTRRRALRK